MSDNVLRSYTIYRSPGDWPGKYVVRRFSISAEHPDPVPDPVPLAVVDTLEQAREAIPLGLVNIHRYLEDEPQIVETWI